MASNLVAMTSNLIGRGYLTHTGLPTCFHNPAFKASARERFSCPSPCPKSEKPKTNCKLCKAVQSSAKQLGGSLSVECQKDPRPPNSFPQVTRLMGCWFCGSRSTV